VPWFWIWTCLIVASLVVAFFVLRVLWRKLRALFDELGRASEVLDRLSERTQELTEALERIEEARAAEKSAFPDTVAAQKQMALVRGKRKAKKAARRRNHSAKRRTWRDIAVDPRFDRWRKK